MVKTIYICQNSDGKKMTKFVFEKPKHPTKGYIFSFPCILFFQTLDKLCSVLLITVHFDFLNTKLGGLNGRHNDEEIWRRSLKDLSLSLKNKN